ncbi:hypothetical protein ABLW17_10900, partial [Anaerococcus murdochii]|uniref:hypothetical protein n=1 Tax=Anaerococcus murdochii TaxID=411577 RepID=UPI0032B4ED5E
TLIQVALVNIRSKKTQITIKAIVNVGDTEAIIGSSKVLNACFIVKIIFKITKIIKRLPSTQ